MKPSITPRNDAPEGASPMPVGFRLVENGTTTYLRAKVNYFFTTLFLLVLVGPAVALVFFYGKYIGEQPIDLTTWIYCLILFSILFLSPLLRILLPHFLAIDSNQQTLRNRWRTVRLADAEELVVRGNLFTLSKRSGTYQLRIKCRGQRSVFLLRHLTKEEGIAIARWLQYETGLPIRVSDHYFNRTF